MKLKNKKKADLRVIIIGGGIGGTAIAVALQNEGIHAEIYEQASSIKEVGAGIGMRPPSVELFKDWGIYKEIESKSWQSDFMEILTGNRDLLIKEEWPLLTENSDERWARLIHRADLINILIRQLPSESVHLNHKCERVINYNDYAEAHFTNGISVDADLIISADGIHSKAHSIFCHVTPVYSGYHAYRAIINEEATFGLSSDNTLRIFVDGQVQIYLLPLQYRKQISVDITVPSEDPSWQPDIEKKDILKHLRNFDPKIQQIVESIEEFNCRALYDIDPLERWSSNCITLLGDAAHAMLHNQGQGANMAIQDAGVLAIALREADSIPEALQQYESWRKPITTRYQKLSRQFPSEQNETAFPEKNYF